MKKIKISNELYSKVEFLSGQVDDTPEHFIDIAIKTYINIIASGKSMEIFKIFQKEESNEN